MMLSGVIGVLSGVSAVSVAMFESLPQNLIGQARAPRAA